MWWLHAHRVQMSWYVYIRGTKILRHDVADESACGDIEDKNDIVHKNESFVESELNNMLPICYIVL